MSKLALKKKHKECVSLVVKFIKLKKIFTNISPHKPDSLLDGKIPDLKKIYQDLDRET